MHICILRRRCWQDCWRYGAPLRVRWGTHPHGHYLAIPGTRWLSKWRSGIIFDWENAVAIQGRSLPVVVGPFPVTCDEFDTTEEEFDHMYAESTTAKEVSRIGLRWLLLKRYFGFS